MNIGIVGLGLIGGSMAKALKNRTSHSVFGIDIDHDTMMLSRIAGAMDAPLSDENIATCHVILLAIRPKAAIAWLEEQAPKLAKDTIVVDLCGVKRVMVEAMNPLAKRHGFAYVGGHPMAGRERSGFTAASEDLYEGASMIFTPNEESAVGVLETLKALFLDIGFASITFSTPEEHDQIIAYTSQLAHIASSAYIKSPEAQIRRGFSAGSFQDMTRVARLDEKMWTELVMADRDFLSSELEIYIQNLQQYLVALKADDATSMETLLREGRELKASAGGN